MTVTFPSSETRTLAPETSNFEQLNLSTTTDIDPPLAAQDATYNAANESNEKNLMITTFSPKGSYLRKYVLSMKK